MTPKPGAIRVAVVNTHPIQYFAPLYAFLNADPRLEVTALYLSDLSVRGGHDKGFGQQVKWDVDVLAGYPHAFVPPMALKKEGLLRHVSPAIFGMIRRDGYDALWLHGHSSAADLIALAAARASRIPVLMRGETHLGLKRSTVKQAARGASLKALYAQCAAFLAIGSANRAFYRSLGIADERIFTVPYAVDNARFAAAAAMTGEQRTAMRRSLGVVDDRPILLYVAKFQRHKRPHDLVAAAAELKAGGNPFHVVLVGSGEMDAELRAQVQALGLDNIHFAGFVNQAGLPQFYGACDVFVLPSETEPWGLVVNEAMAAGMPVVATDAVGAAADLVREGVNGAVYKAGDVSGLARALAPIVADAALRADMSAASRAIMSTWSFSECKDGLLAALACVAPKRFHIGAARST